MFTISSQPFYDSFSQQYKNIYVVDRKPDGAFGKIIRQVAAPKLSPFKTNENDYCSRRLFTLFIILITQMSYCVLMKLHYYSVT